jgi:hypothetical protein
VTTEFQIDPARRTVFTRSIGHSDLEEQLDFQRRLRAHPAFDPSFQHLYDARELAASNITSDGMKTLAESSPWGPQSRLAVVVSQDFGYGMSRMYQMRKGADSTHMSIFRSLEEALAWLGIDRAPE